ncbi:MAG: hypothetical protein ACU83O_11355, partial [Gammaproteobacteria bacterium]
ALSIIWLRKQLQSIIYFMLSIVIWFADCDSWRVQARITPLLSPTAYTGNHYNLPDRSVRQRLFNAQLLSGRVKQK